MLVDSSKVIAQRATGDGCAVVWAEYEAMPHCFPLILELPQSEHSFKSCADFCKACVEDPSNLRTQGAVVHTSMEATPVDVRNLISLSLNEVKTQAQEEMRRQIRDFGKTSDVQSKL